MLIELRETRKDSTGDVREEGAERVLDLPRVELLVGLLQRCDRHISSLLLTVLLR